MLMKPEVEVRIFVKTALRLRYRSAQGGSNFVQTDFKL